MPCFFLFYVFIFFMALGVSESMFVHQNFEYLEKILVVTVIVTLSIMTNNGALKRKRFLKCTIFGNLSQVYNLSM